MADFCESCGASYATASSGRCRHCAATRSKRTGVHADAEPPLGRFGTGPLQWFCWAVWLVAAVTTVGLKLYVDHVRH